MKGKLGHVIQSDDCQVIAVNVILMLRDCAIIIRRRALHKIAAKIGGLKVKSLI